MVIFSYIASLSPLGLHETLLKRRKEEKKRKKKKQYLLVRNLPFLSTSRNFTLIFRHSFLPQKREAFSYHTIYSNSSILSLVPTERPTVACLLSGILCVYVYGQCVYVYGECAHVYA